MKKALVRLTGWFFILYGFSYAVAPIEMSNLVTGGTIDSSSGNIDMRATYGGMSIAVGFFLLVLAKHNRTLALSLGFTAFVLLTMAVARIVGMVVEGQPNLLMYIYLALEILAGSAALFFWKTSVSTIDLERSLSRQNR